MSSPIDDVCDWLTTDCIEADIQTITSTVSDPDEEAEMQDTYEKLVDYVQSNIPSLVHILLLHAPQSSKMQLLMLYQLYQNARTSSEKYEILRSYTQLFEQLSKEEANGVHAQGQPAPKIPTDASTLFANIHALPTTVHNRNLLLEKARQLNASRAAGDGEMRKLQQWFQYALQLPHERKFEYPLCNSALLVNIRRRLDEQLYGMDFVKEQILSAVTARFQGIDMFQILALVGPPGVGKTKLAFTIAKTLNIPFAFVSFGGVLNAEVLKGHDFTYMASQPGMLARALINTGASNGIVYIDEFDKGLLNEQCCATLLHLLDPEQNCKFMDNYFGDLHLDFSRTWFILSMNEQSTNSAINDRITYIDIPPYSREAKKIIVQNYLFPTEIERYNKSEILPLMTLSENGAEELLSLLEQHEELFTEQTQTFPSLRTIKHALHLMFQRMLLTITASTAEIPTNIMRSYQPLVFSKVLDQAMVAAILKPILLEKRKTREKMRRLYSRDKIATMYS